ncbi:MAG: excinuclease ABC subunit UvrA, partial [Pirellulales bacterium]
DLVSKYTGGKSKPQLRGLEKFMRVMHCHDCRGERLNAQARAVTLRTTDASFAERAERSLPEVCRLPISEAARFFSQLDLDGPRAVIAAEALKEICGRLGFLTNVGLDYLTLERTAPTLSGGESQRIRLAGQIGCGLVGVLYILDEPSIGLHPRDNDQLLATLEQLRDQGNTVVVVEHDEDTMRAADHLIDFGPGAGVRGGEVVASGRVDDLCRQPKSVTGQFLAGREKIERPRQTRPRGEQRLRVIGATHNNLAGIDIDIPLGSFVCVTGVSGSGKSSLVGDILVEALRRDLNGGKARPGRHKRITGLTHLDKMIAIDQSPIGRTPRSNPGTYIKVFDDIRNLYAQLPESKRRGYRPGRFSFNVRGGRCEACEGNGANRLEMDFLADLWVTCPACDGHRFTRETLAVRFKGKSIADVLEMDVQQALVHFENIPAIRHKLQTLHDVGLDYIKIGQPSPTLSGGEAQRIKLARELVKKSTGRTLYILDEPTTGLHFADIRLLLDVLHRFVDAGNTVLVVEHNLEVIKTADWVIDLGPEGGAGGGRIVVEGTVDEVARATDSYTGLALAAMLNGAKGAADNGQRNRAAARRPAVTQQIVVRGAAQHNLKDVHVKIPRDQLTVFCGPSGSGKSSLAMDTIYAEGQRRYVESLSSYARQFVGQMQKPKLDHIEGLSPAIAIEQRNTGHTPRSTVGTVTEIYDYLRILYARLGTPYCPDCDLPIGTQSIDDIVDKITSQREGTKLMLLAPRQIEVGQSYATLWDELRQSGYVRVRIDRETYLLDEVPAIDRRRRHDVEVVVDRITVRKAARGRIAESVESALAIGKGVVHVATPKPSLAESSWPVRVHSCHLACERCGRSFDALSPHHFSFNSALGWCPSCEGLGTQTGANPAALIRDPKRTLAEGAILVWPAADNPLFTEMLGALSQQTGLPIDVPFEKLSPRQRRLILYGTGDQWIELPAATSGKGKTRAKLRFQYKGLYPALEEASRLSPALRGKLEHLVDEIECSECAGSRLQDAAAAVQFRGQTIRQVALLPLGELLEACRKWKLSAREKRIAGELLREIQNRLTFLTDVGLDYLSLGRPAPTLSGGEAQRIRLASQVGSGLCGVLYVLDEPTIGLHPRDNRRLIDALKKLRDLGNTLLVVEHDREVVGSADRLLDFGPGAGRHGGEIVAQGTPRQIADRKKSVTGPYLSGRAAIAVPTERRMSAGAGAVVPSTPERTTGRTKKRKALSQRSGAESPGGWLEVVGARQNNLQNIDVRIPLGTLTVVTGPSGSGKSSLVEEIIYNQLARTLHRARTVPGAHDAIGGVEAINKVIRVDQRPLGNSPMSNPATYTGAFELIRELFAQLPEAKLRGYAPRRFSFNVPGGRCDACDGAGRICIEMHFLPDVWVECETCHGKRYQEETLTVRYHGRSIADVLEIPCGEA